jgi:hypothetical protein
MAQFKAGLYKKEVLDAMTRVQNIRANLQILRNLGLSWFTVNRNFGPLELASWGESLGRCLIKMQALGFALGG